MRRSRPVQLLFPFFTEPCYVCWQVFRESGTAPLPLAFPSLTGDGLCASHRARLQEGACLYCGRRLAWLRMAGNRELAVCRPCFAQRKGEAVARAVEAMRDGDIIGLIGSW